ncbi:hypothetical protein Ahy_B10g100692 [Arachis hypogaea]|uniref:Protein FAR1-RELATED SEQUENCE n=1 Tax=Arachis hypogaea TaxID=3818 RepID=A0A444WXE3_ARAHY|nr:hypothetical protein Ahy_B10g100692 [Arachis hypogaea]
MKYGLVEHKWLSKLYEDRHIWISIYLDHHFWAGMRSTQKSESMHVFFNNFIMQNSSLIQFVKQYNNCLGSREQRERELDAANFHTVMPCATKSSIEAQFQQVYNHQKFREVQPHFKGKVFHHKINELCSRLFGIRSCRTSFQLNIQQVCDYIRLGSSTSEMPVLIIQVKRDIVLSCPKRVKL